MAEASRTYWLTSACRIKRKDQSLVIETVMAQVRLCAESAARLKLARSIVLATGFNVRRVVDRSLLARPQKVLEESVAAATTTEQLMGAEGTFRRSAWEVLDTRLPEWLQLNGRSRRPPRNAGNAFISYVNGIVYARVLTPSGSHRSTPESHSCTAPWRGSATLWCSIWLRCSNRCSLNGCYYGLPIEISSSPIISTSTSTRRCSATRDASSLCKPSATNSRSRKLGRPVTYDELLSLEALQLTRTCLEGSPYKPFRIWW